MNGFLLTCAALLLLIGVTNSTVHDSSEFGMASGAVNTTCKCGMINKSKKRIVGGEEAGKDVWPMVAEISTEEFHLCAGTVITERHVLTAGHCGINPLSLEKLPKEMFDVFVGIYEILGDNAYKGGQKLSVENFVIHPKYIPLGKKNDIAILYLTENIIFSAKVGPACLPTRKEKIFNEKITVLGWGQQLYDVKDDSPILLKAVLDVVHHEECKIYKHYLKKTNFCVHTAGKDTCQGDSGGPALWRDPETNRYVVIGAISYGRGCGKHPGVYSNIINYIPWIKKVILKTNPNYQICTKVFN